MIGRAVRACLTGFLLLSGLLAQQDDPVIKVVKPDFEEPSQKLYYVTIGVATLLTLILLAAFLRMTRRIVSDRQEPTLEDRLRELAGQVQQFAYTARRFAITPPDAAATKPAAPGTPSRTHTAPEPSQPPTIYLPSEPVVSHGVRPAPPADVRDEVLAAYLQACASSNPQDRERFETQYQVTPMTCSNHEEWKRNKNTTLRFQPGEFGWYLVVGKPGSPRAFPGFKKDLADQRETFEGVFLYPAGAQSNLRIVEPATLRSDGEDYVLESPGRVEVDV
jgi:hypothetical protein